MVGVPCLTEPSTVAVWDDGWCIGLRASKPVYYCARRGSVVVRLLASNLCELGSIPGRVAPGFPHVKFVPDDNDGRRVFSGISHPPCIPVLLHTHPIHPNRLSRQNVGPTKLMKFLLNTNKLLGNSALGAQREPIGRHFANEHVGWGRSVKGPWSQPRVQSATGAASWGPNQKVGAASPGRSNELSAEFAERLTAKMKLVEDGAARDCKPGENRLTSAKSMNELHFPVRCCYTNPTCTSVVEPTLWDQVEIYSPRQLGNKQLLVLNSV
ncbi:hypothetical protein PR048_030985 [Dryococelus australis]|uniref:Uncharacterized protein n=1 Tax=Dryococelus australis TaxID=614101 RepID=A0ABQ9G3Y9_9NEOP|nr:hypothetical protein PR048_030985 [Dryococelus australis]